MFWYGIILAILFLIPLLVSIKYTQKTNKSYDVFYFKVKRKDEFIKNSAIIITILMVIFNVLFYASYHSSVMYREVRNYHIVKISHQEKYSKRVSYTVRIPCGRDKNGNTKYRTETRYRTDYLGPYFIAYSNSGNEFAITESEYNYWKNKWNTEKHIRTIKGTTAAFSKRMDGKYFEATWNNEFYDIYPKPEVHFYKNVLRNSNSVFGFKYGGDIKHPVDNGNTNGVISDISLTASETSEFAFLNALEGGRHQIHIITIITTNRADNSLETLNNWGGLNKNELAVFIGVDNNRNIIWCNTHSWMDNSKCEDAIRDRIVMLKIFDAAKIREIYQNNLKYWNRKQFKDFDYIEVKTPTSSVIIFWIGIIVFVVGLLIIVLKNKR